jgi:hypothetical protein
MTFSSHELPGALADPEEIGGLFAGDLGAARI